MLVTGMSGAGKSTALKALEDAGYEAVDNLPVSLLPALVAAPSERPLAIGIDTRTRAFLPDALAATLGEISRPERPVRLLFLDCSGAELVRRFGETRRPHPLALDRPASDGIARERELLDSLRRTADLVIDTTDHSPHDLRRVIITRFAQGDVRPLTLTLVSFGYSRGIPRDADLVFDMRFLRNPHWDPALRPLDGLDPAVRAHVEADPSWSQAFERIMALLLVLLPGYRREGRAYVTVAFGCTGGRHRSVATAEAAGAALQEAGWANLVMHRDRGHQMDEAALEQRTKKERE
ncbi:MAG: RNase adapter RapZ [Sphingomonadaceae bacterium]